MNGAAPSPRTVPLPSSPPTFTTHRSSPARLQAQPSHRTSPLMPFYPSLTIDDARATPSGLDVAAVFERPTPRLSPSSSRITVVPAPVASRTPSADPRSPISRLARLPGSIMEISRFARAFYILLIFAVCLLRFVQEPFLWSSDASEERFGCANYSVKFWRVKKNGFQGGELN